LTIHIPKAALPQPKRIQIEAGQSKQQASVGNGSDSGQKSTSNRQTARRDQSSAQNNSREESLAQAR